jgi:serine/threonine-protein kinase HipA
VLSVAPYPKYYYGDDLSLRLLNSELEAVFSEAYEQYGYYTGYDFITFGQQIGLSNSATKKLIKQLCSAVEGAYEYIINASQCPDGMKHEIKSHIAEKLGRLSRPYPVNLV